MTSFTDSSRRLRRATARAVGAVALAAAALSAQAASYTFSGAVDFGDLFGQAYSGSFSFADAAAGFDGAIVLDSFTLAFQSQTYSLADAPLMPVASFAGGSFLGVDYNSIDPTALRPQVTLASGFSSAGEAFFAYRTSGDAVGFGNLAFTNVSAVPEPGSLAMMAAGLAAIGWTVRRRRRG